MAPRGDLCAVVDLAPLNHTAMWFEIAQQISEVVTQAVVEVPNSHSVVGSRFCAKILKRDERAEVVWVHVRLSQ